MFLMAFYTRFGVYFVAGYCVWIYLDRDTCKTGGRRLVLFVRFIGII